jgi:hypothetical protein
MIINSNPAYFPKMLDRGGRTNLFYPPKYFRKGKGERKDRTKEVMEKVI